MRNLVTFAITLGAIVGLFLVGGSPALADGIGLGDGLGRGQPDELGRFQVGHTTINIVGGGTLGELRPIDVEVWYPADKESWDGASASEYTSRLNGVPLVPAKWDPLSWAVVSEVAREGADFDKHGPFPVVIFSHGSQNSPFEYALTLEHLASHGYVVVGPWYNGDTQDDVRVQFINTTNGSKVLDCLDHMPVPCVDTAAKNIADRALDLTTVLNTLPAALGRGNVNMEEIVAMGHSRGTVTSLGAAGGSTFFHFKAEPRVKAVLGFAAAMPALIFNIDLSAITVPTVLVAGEVDLNTPPALSETVFGTISSQDRAFIVIKNTRHRHFASGFCSELQASGSVVLANPTRAILDRHTLNGIMNSPINGSAVDICGYDYFTNPVDIRSLITFPANFVVTPESVPTLGIDTLEVHRLMSEIAVGFFRSVVKELRHEDCDEGPCPDGRFNHIISERFLLKKEPNVLSSAVVSDEDMKHLDCGEDHPD